MGSFCEPRPPKNSQPPAPLQPPLKIPILPPRILMVIEFGGSGSPADIQITQSVFPVNPHPDKAAFSVALVLATDALVTPSDRVLARVRSRGCSRQLLCQEDALCRAHLSSVCGTLAPP